MTDQDDAGLVREGLLEAIETQVQDNQPPAASATLERLLRAGYSREDALLLMARVLSSEMFEMLEQGRGHDIGKYSRGLEALPEMIYERDEEGT